MMSLKPKKGTSVFYTLVTTSNIQVKEGIYGIHNPFQGEGYVEYSTTKNEAIKNALYRQQLLKIKEKREKAS